MRNQSEPAGWPLAAVGFAAILFGAGTAIFNMLGWYHAQTPLSFFGQATKLFMVLRFYLAQGLATAVVVLGTYFVYRSLLRLRVDSGSLTVGAIISEALRSSAARRIGILASLAYAAFYAFASSILVYQPGVDFLRAYGVSAPDWSAVACCGSPGTVPSLVLFLSPQLHLALQLIPINIMFVVLLPLLVGFNSAIAGYAVANRVKMKGRWLSSVGVMAGIFTGCPTCAGYFLASAIGGVGATTLAVALAPYQLLFISISIPLLLLSPFIIAARVKALMRAGCDRVTASIQAVR